MRLALSHPAASPTRDLWSRLSALLVMSRSRRALRALDDHLLTDIGLSRAEAISEAARPVWDAPDRWRG